jgi:Skp family chaperone for outer membrane proteins
MPMTISSRATWALGLGLLGAAALVAPSAAQQKSTEKPAAPAPATIACVDLQAVMKDYEKCKDQNEAIKAEAIARQKLLSDLVARGQQVGREMQSLIIGSPEYKVKDNELTKLQAELAAERDKAQREFAQKEAESLATIYKEVQACVKRAAEFLGYSHVVQISNEPVNSANPDSVMAAWGRSIVFHDAKTDITRTVVATLNNDYNAARGPRPAASASGAATQNSGAPASKAAARPSTNSTGGASKSR